MPWQVDTIAAVSRIHQPIDQTLRVSHHFEHRQYRGDNSGGLSRKNGDDVLGPSAENVVPLLVRRWIFPPRHPQALNVYQPGALNDLTAHRTADMGHSHRSSSA
jgi:hypothetical protein